LKLIKADNSLSGLPCAKYNYGKACIRNYLILTGYCRSHLYRRNLYERGSGEKNIKAIIFSGLLGAVFFFAGIGLARNTKDKAT
jgi:hypothetical protein